MLWYRSGSIDVLRSISPGVIRCLDVETTGLSPSRDEILQIAVVDGEGATCLHSLVKPARHGEWGRSQAIHHVSPFDVSRAPSMEHVLPLAEGALACAGLLVGYNLPFDLAFLDAAGASVGMSRRFDVMREFAPVLGQRGRCGGFRWQSLAVCAAYYGVELRPHDALADARAALACFYRMLEDDGSRYHRPGSTPYLTLVGSH